MRNLVWKLGLIALVLAVCILSISVKEWRLGKDLRGGVSLIYKVNLPEDTSNPGELLTQIIDVLKQRVDPNGVYDISMEPEGRDRIVVTSPLPDQKVLELKAAFDDAIAELLKRSEIRLTVLDDALQRGVANVEIGGDSETERGQIIASLQQAYQDRADAREALATALANGVAAEEQRRLELAVAEAEITFEDLYDDVAQLSLSEVRIRRVLGLSTDKIKLLDEERKPILDENGEQKMGPSPRDTELESLKADFPHLVELIDATVETHDAYQAKRKGFDDPQDLMRLLRGAGVLEFRIAVLANNPQGVDIVQMRSELAEFGPANTTSPNAKWMPINELKQWYETPEDLVALEQNPENYFSGNRGLVAAVYDNEYYLLMYNMTGKMITHDEGVEWSITQTYPTADRMGRPAVAFNLDSAGGSRMGVLTAKHINEPMGIILDGEVYSAPNIQSQITTNGQITGQFSQQELSYLLRVLDAGALSARLEPNPISISILGPSIGKDNQKKGIEALAISIIAVAGFMLLYYLVAASWRTSPCS